MAADAAPPPLWLPDVVAPPRPAAGVGFTQQWAASGIVRVLAVGFTLVTAAAVAARLVSVTLEDDLGAALASVPAPFTQAASLTTRYTFGVGLVAFGAADAARIGTALPPLTMDGGMRLTVAIANVQGADQVSEARIAVEQQNVRP